MKCPLWLYKRINDRGRIPRWVRWVWRRAHWCPEMDELLIVDNGEDCFCGIFVQREEYDIKFIWPPKFTFVWRGVLIRLAGYYEQGLPEGPELLELLAAYLEESSATTDDFIEWSKRRKEHPK